MPPHAPKKGMIGIPAKYWPVLRAEVNLRNHHADVFLKHIASAEKQRHARRFARTFSRPGAIRRITTRNGTYIVDIGFALHESPFAVSLFSVKGTKRTNMFDAKLIFPEMHAVNIVAVQGVFGVPLEKLRDFERAVGMPAANFLVKEIEAHARRGHYTKVRLIRPESLLFYKRPVLENEFAKTEKGRALWKIFDQTVNPKPVFTNEQAREFDAMYMRFREKTRGRIKKLYEGLAEAAGYASCPTVMLLPSPHAHEPQYFWEKTL